VAIRAKDVRPDAVNHDDIKDTCSKCGFDVWLPAVSAKLLNTRLKYAVRCLQCAEFLEDGTEARPVKIV
jgi:hypothetical protein